MGSPFRIYAAWPPCRDPLERLEQQTLVFLTALRWIHERLGPWQFEDVSSGQVVPVDGAAACKRAFAQAAYKWQMGNSEHTCYQPDLVLGSPVSPIGQLSITMGIQPMPLAPIFAPNRVDLRLHENESWVNAAVLEAVLRAAIAVFRPTFGFVGREDAPEAPEALFSDGTPAVGWMTYLSAAYPPLPALSAPAEVRQVAELGNVVVAHPDVFDSQSAKHLAATEAVHAALANAAVLAPAHLVGGGAPS